MSELCRLCAGLCPEDIQRLTQIENQLPLMAALTDADVFIDCFTGNDTAVVAAHARPPAGVSAYDRDVVGANVRRELEPAVFHARDTGLPVADLKAITQENKAVRQNAAPILGRNGDVIAVLVRERDVSDALRREQKLRLLEQEHADAAPLGTFLAPDQQTLAIREANHRVKNNLQLMASILNLQAMQSRDENVRRVLKENLERVLSIAAIHDIIAHTDRQERVDSLRLLARLRENLQMLIPPDKGVRLETGGDDFPISADAATSVSLVVTELVMNAIEHAFPKGTGGAVTVTAYRGALYSSFVVADDGCGFDPGAVSADSLGLSIVRATVTDTLKGHLRMETAGGSKISFDFPNLS